jgi:6-pyruvoyltetrahydropterin/6-carboxytetrahydropterin synthase
MLEVFREFHFDAAHRLENLPEGHKCARVHGHTYRLTVYVAGEGDPVMGWIVDFAELKRITEGVIGQLDHRLLNDVPGLEQPTTERVVVWIWDQLKPELPGLSRLRLWENATSGCEYVGAGVQPGATG